MPDRRNHRGLPTFLLLREAVAEEECMMAKASISIGMDDATGQPADVEGPYITDEDDGSRPRKKRPSRAVPNRLKTDADRRRANKADEDLASRRKGPAQP